MVTSYLFSRKILIKCLLFLQLIDKLSVRTPTGEVKLKVMKEIAKEYQIEWNTAESEKELLKAPEELIVSSPLPLSLMQNSNLYPI